MTQKLKILGPYTPEHEGPFCTRDGLKARIICRDRYGDWSVVALVSDGEGESVRLYSERGRYSSRADNSLDLMNAVEVPVAQEFWLNEFKRADGHIGFSYAHDTELKAINERHELENWNWTRTIHVREVLPGEGE